MNKWTTSFWVDLAERVGATFLGALLGLLTLTGTTPVDFVNWEYMWPVVGVPVLVSLLKGLLANMAHPESGASAVGSPPGPEVRDEGGYAVLGALGLGLVVLSVILLVLLLLGVYSVSPVVLVVLFVIGLVLLFLDRGPGRRVL